MTEDPMTAREGAGREGHICHAEGCTRPVAPRFLMCRYHWGRVPRDLQADVYRLYRPGQERDKRPSIEYLDAMQRAINHVAKIEGKQERPLPSVLIERLRADIANTPRPSGEIMEQQP